jgi:low temperature requirement protein LtrA
VSLIPKFGGLLRKHEGHTRVTYVELFFDLVFVFAVTQLSHNLLHHLTWTGLAETLFLTLAVWWVWIYTSWCTNWLDPQSTPVRVLLFVLMLAGLVLSSSIPEAFGERGLAFALAYACMQLVRTAFMLNALRGERPGNYRNFQRILVWLVISAVFWIAGAFLETPWRYAVWGVALTIEFLGPAASFWLPGIGKSLTTDWDVSADHFAERCALFIIIALGESLLVTGATFADLEWSFMTLLSFAAGFAGSVAMWWLYFSMAVEDAAAEFAKSTDPGRVARLAYTYMHIPLVMGIILAAVGDELVLAHPSGKIEPLAGVAILGGPTLFLAGNLLFKRVLFGELLKSHVSGLAICIGLIPSIAFATPLFLSAATTAVLILVGLWENRYALMWKKQTGSLIAGGIKTPDHQKMH